MADMTTYNSLAEDAEFREYVTNMTQRRDKDTCVAYPINRASWQYAKYLDMVRSAVIKYRSLYNLSPPEVSVNLSERQCLDPGIQSQGLRYKTEKPTASQALIFYSFFYENGVQPADSSIILRVQHGNEYHQFHVLSEDTQSFEFWRHHILSTSRAVDRRTEYSADYTRQHMLTCSSGDSTFEFLQTYGK